MIYLHYKVIWVWGVQVFKKYKLMNCVCTHTHIHSCTYMRSCDLSSLNLWHVYFLSK